MDFCEMSSTSCRIPDWLNKSFIQNTLRVGYKDSSLCIANLEVTPVTSPGDNYVSELYRVVIELVAATNGKSRSVIIKCLPTAEYNLKFICEARLFEKEINVYNTTLPAMEAVNLAPRCFFTSDDMLVLEDLTPLGFKMVDRRCGLDLDHCRAAIRTLARLHAKSVKLPASELISSYPETVYHDYDHAQKYIQHSLTSLACVVERWESQYSHFGAIIRRLSKTVLDELLVLMPRQPTAEDKHLYVLNHGDFWSNNIMFRYNGSAIEEVRILDYQMCRYARLSLDLQYFLYTSVREQDQLLAEEILLEAYHTEFCASLNCHDRLTMEQLRSDMKRTEMFGFVNACMMLPVVLSDPAETSPDLANVADKEANIFDWHTGTQFRRHFQTILKLFQEKGLFKCRC